MKLKYYLRGLGIGIVVAVFITSISFQNRQPMTDEEIKARAAELGMIENSVLTDRVNKDKDEEPVDESQNEPSEEPNETLGETEEEPQKEPDADVEEPNADTEAEEPSEETQDNKEDTQTTTENVKDTISITVVSGDTSWTVSKRMEEAGLIESAKDFDTHLCRYGYDKKISVGTYKIPVSATHEEMAKILTRMD